MHHIQNRPVRKKKQLSLQSAITVHGKFSQLKKANHENITPQKSFRKEAFFVFGNTFLDIINFLQIFIYAAWIIKISASTTKNQWENTDKQMEITMQIIHFDIIFIAFKENNQVEFLRFPWQNKNAIFKVWIIFQSHYSLAVNDSRSKQIFFFRNSFIAHTVQ